MTLREGGKKNKQHISVLHYIAYLLFSIFMAEFTQVYYLEVAFYYFSTCKGNDEVYQRRAPQHEC